MLFDIFVIARKEWKEFLTGQGLRGGLVNILVIVIVFGVFLPSQFGREFIKSPINLLFWAWLPAFLVIAGVADSFAGERERHTLETLFASRLSDRALLLGKLTGIVSYGWGLTVLSLTLGLISMNILYRDGALLLPPSDIAVGVLVISFLVALVTAELGAYLSMEARSTRQVFQAMSLTWMFLIFGVSYGVRAGLGLLPRQTADAIIKWVIAAAAANSRASLVGVAAMILLAFGGLLFYLAEVRLQRLRCMPS